MAVAIIGMGVRFPGEASTPEGFWEMLLKARSAQTEIPKSRYSSNGFYHPDPDRLGSTPVTKAHVLAQDPLAFDAPFFSIKPKEAKTIDPQQRMLLEVTYQAFENAGLQVESLKQSQTSCYVGTFTSDYKDQMIHDNEGYSQYSGAGLAPSLVSNRVSWFFDLKGPSMTLDTACSSSLIAFHLAYQSIQSGESEMSIAAGTNLILGPYFTLQFSAAKILSSDGRSNAFDHKANGFGRGEGIGVLILKSIDAAIRDGDTIRAVILGSAANHDGRTPAVSHPSTEGQVALIRAAYKRARISPRLTGYFEAHGTGTPTGDPLEINAISEIFGPERASDLLVGSVKTNIGHLEGASGIAGVIKAVLVVERGIIPPNLWFEKLNPRITLPKHIKISTHPAVWMNPGPRVASVNSFGFGGANAHCIVQDAHHFLTMHGLPGKHCTDINPRLPLSLPDCGMNGNDDRSDRQTNGGNDHDELLVANQKPKLLVVSSQDRQGVSRIAERLAVYLEERIGFPPQPLLNDLVYSLSERRGKLPWKSFVFAHDLKHLREGLNNLSPAVRSSRQPRLAFCFSGQGAHWYAMGRELFAYEAFCASIESCEKILRSLGCTWSLREELHRAEDICRLDAAEFSQAACSCLQISLVDLLHHWGVHATAVTGHSSGEIAAAYAAGAVSRYTAVGLAWYRGCFAAAIEQNETLKGAMLAVRAGGDEISSLIRTLPKIKGTIGIACYNSPKNCTISGDQTEIEKLQVILESKNIGFTKLRINVAYHSPHMQSIASAYLKAIIPLTEMKGIQISPAWDAVPFFSSVRGNIMHPNMLGSEYWVSNLVNPVKFTDAIQSLIRCTSKDTIGHGNGLFVEGFVEIGPHTALRAYIMETCSKEAEPVSLPYFNLLRRKQDAFRTAFTALGEMWCLGYDLNMYNINETGARVKLLVDLPPYPFNHSTSYSQESVIAKEYRLRAHPRTDLLGYSYPGALFPQWRNFLRLSENPWIADHKIQSHIIYPGAGLIVMAMEAIRQLADPHEKVTRFELRDVVIGNALRVPSDEAGIEVMTQVKAANGSAKVPTRFWSEFTVASRSVLKDTCWQAHCEGMIRLHFETQSTSSMEEEISQENEAYAKSFSEAVMDCKPLDKSFYQMLASASLEYGPTFQNVTDVHLGSHAGRAIVRIPDTKAVMPHGFEYPFVIHPATLDSIVQMIFPAISDAADSIRAPLVPVSIENLYISANIPTKPGTSLNTFAKSAKGNDTTWNVSVCAFETEKNVPLVTITGLGVASLGETPKQGLSSEGLCLQTVWKEDVDFLSAEQTQEIIYSSAEPDPYDDIHYEMVDLVCLPYIQKAVNWLDNEGRNHLPDSGIRKLYHEWMLGKLRENHDLLSSASTLSAKSEQAAKMLRGTEAGAVVMELIDRVGINLEGIFRGEVEPLQVMLEGGLLYDFYRIGLGTSFNNNVAEYMAMLGHKKAGQLSVLEIGAGTGGTTRRILERLRNEDGSSMVAHYVFTDISPGFLANAAENFARDAAIMEFKIFNIEEDPTKQGFEPESFDVLVCANVLHATKSMNKTLTRCRLLLKEGGKLVLAELTETPIFTAFLMGPLPGWWLGEDDGRKGGPLLSVSRWNEALAKSGFTGVDIHVHGDANSRSSKNPTSLLVSTKAVNSSESTVSKHLILLIVDENAVSHSYASGLHDLLSRTNQSVSILPWHSVSKSTVREAYCICLLELEKSFLMNICGDDFTKLKDLLYNAGGVCWITRGASIEASKPELSLVTGLFRTVSNEDEKVKLMVLDMDSEGTSVGKDSIALALKIISTHIVGRTLDYEFAIRNGIAQIPRLLALSKFDDAIRRQHNQGITRQFSYVDVQGPVKLSVGQPGLLNSLHLERDKSYHVPLSPDSVEIEVKAAGLNFQDVLIATGKVRNLGLGIEGSGIVTRVGENAAKLWKKGDRVFGYGVNTFSKFARFSMDAVLQIPENLSFEEAASLIVTYTTVYYAFFETGRLRAGESVLIHSAAGGVGQAAIVLAKHIGADIYCTVGSEKKRALLIDEYGIPEDHIFNSRDLSFAKAVMRMTENRGVDVILNSLAGEALRLSWHCLAEFGRFLELGKIDMLSNIGLEMRPFLRNRTFVGINLADIMQRPRRALQAMIQGVSNLLREGIMTAAKPVTNFNIGVIEQAIRLMQTGEHVGKIVIQMSADSQVMYAPPPPVMSLRSDATYVLAGGIGGVGRGLAYFLVSNGAKNLLFLSRSAASAEDNRVFLEGLRKEHCIHALAYDCDVTINASLEKALRSAQKTMPPVKGVVMGAMVLQDSVFENMNIEQWNATIRPKVHGSLNLHNFLPKDLDFFVLLSSTLAVMGYRGQANYQAGNVFQDALAHHRFAQGLPALSINIGVVPDAGWISEHRETSEHNLRIAGLRESPISHITAVMAEWSSSDPQSAHVIMGLPTDHVGEPFYWMQPARFNTLRATKKRYKVTTSGRAEDTARPLLRDELSQAPSLQVATRVMMGRLSEWLARLMMVPIEDIDPQKPLTSYGIDSLVAVEFRNWIVKETGFDLTNLDIMRSVPMTQLGQEIAKKFKVGRNGDIDQGKEENNE